MGGRRKDTRKFSKANRVVRLWTLKPYAKMPNSMPGTQRALNTLHNKQVDKQRLERMSLWKGK